MQSTSVLVLRTVAPRAGAQRELNVQRRHFFALLAAAMGRTAFAERFRAVVGAPPLQYLTLWRMQHAKRLLAESRLPTGGRGWRSGSTASD